MEGSPSPDRRGLVRECWTASAGIVLFLGALKHLGMVVPLIYAHAATAAAVVELYAPIMMIGRRGITSEDLGLTARTWKRDLLICLALAAVVTVPFAVAHHYWQTSLFHRVFHWRMPPGLLETVFAQVVVVALPEELFFRGWLQGRLEKLWPPGESVLAQVFSRAVLTAAAVFALAHFIGEYRPDRLGPFFPALIFGALRTRTRSIFAPVVFHAYCNVLGDVLWAFYR